MNVFIENTLNGLGPSHLELTSEPSATIDSLISAFCIEKAIRIRPQYVLKNKQNVVLDNAKTLEGCGIVAGDILYLTSRNEEQQIFGFHNWWILAGVACFIGIIGLTTVSILFVMNGRIPFGFGIVFDAGSSHTTMIIYRWDGEKDEGTGEVSQIQSCDANGSISDHVNAPKTAGKILEDCLGKAKQKIPHDQLRESRVYLGATAGMRLLNISNPEGAKAVMDSVSETLAASAFEFHPEQSRILTGQEEGVFGWITVNYLSKTLPRTIPQMETFGALDMGGASTQISFVSHDGEFVDLRLYGYNYHVFSVSFQCFGLNEFRRRFHYQLIQESNGTQLLDNPCSQNGFEYNVSSSNLFGQVCTDGANNDSANKNYTFVGNFSQTRCESAVKRLLDFSTCRKDYSDCLNSENIPERKGKFMAFSGFYNVLNDLNITKGNLLDVENQIGRFCNMTKEEISHHPPRTGVYDLSQLCLSSQYVLILLRDVYSFEDSSAWSNVSFVDELGNAEVGWSLGFMTNATNAIPAEDPLSMLSLPAFVVLVVLFIVFILTGIAFLLQSWKLSRRSASYQRFSQYGAI